MSHPKYEFMCAEETAIILGITPKRLYKVCEFFDQHDDDNWDLVEGEHFVWENPSLGSRRFSEEGAMAIAKYLHETDTKGKFAAIVDTVIERVTHRRKRVRQMLVRRRVILEVQDLNGVIVKGDLVFIERPRVIRLLDTNGKGLNAAARREQANQGLDGREQMEPGVHFDLIDETQYWSQRGIVRIAQNMSENLTQKSRQAWTEAVAEIYEEAITEQKYYLDSFDAKVSAAKKRVKQLANHCCQVSREKATPTNNFNLDVHHLFDQATRPDLAAMHSNLIAVKDSIHQGFHQWHGKQSCEPKHFIEYLTTVEAWRFEKASKSKRLHALINELTKLQHTFEQHIHIN